MAKINNRNRRNNLKDGVKGKKAATGNPKRKNSNGKVYDIPHYPQSEEFTSAAACAMMVLKYINKNFKVKKDEEFAIWQDAVNGSVWHGSRYGLAYALAKRGAKPEIVTNSRNEGYEKKLAVFEGVNVDTLQASFEEIRKKVLGMKIKETIKATSLDSIKKHLVSGKIPIVVVNASALNPEDKGIEDAPHWVVVKGFDKDLFYINDPYSDTTISIEPQQFRQALGYDREYNTILVPARRVNK